MLRNRYSINITLPVNNGCAYFLIRIDKVRLSKEDNQMDKVTRQFRMTPFQENVLFLLILKSPGAMHMHAVVHRRCDQVAFWILSYSIFCPL